MMSKSKIIKFDQDKVFLLKAFLFWMLAFIIAGIFSIGCGNSDNGGGSTLQIVDNTVPVLISKLPDESAIGFSLNDGILVVFSAEMDPATITAGTFIVQAGLTTVPGTVTCSGNTASFEPVADILPSTIYTVTITTGAKSIAGVSLAAEESWNFTSDAWNYSSLTDMGVVYTAPVGDAYYPSILFEENGFEDPAARYAMWYTDGLGAGFLVTSADGTAWSVPTAITGLGNDAHHVQVLYDANNFGLGDLGPKYRIWYWDTDAPLYGITAISSAESVDGINWTNDVAIS